MKTDPAIDAIRKTRRSISQRFGHDTKALVAHYQELQKKYADRLAKDSTVDYVRPGVDDRGADRAD